MLSGLLALAMTFSLAVGTHADEQVYGWPEQQQEHSSEFYEFRELSSLEHEARQKLWDLGNQENRRARMLGLNSRLSMFAPGLHEGEPFIIMVRDLSDGAFIEEILELTGLKHEDIKWMEGYFQSAVLFPEGYDYEHSHVYEPVDEIFEADFEEVEEDIELSDVPQERWVSSSQFQVGQRVEIRRNGISLGGVAIGHPADFSGSRFITSFHGRARNGDAVFMNGHQIGTVTRSLFSHNADITEVTVSSFNNGRVMLNLPDGRFMNGIGPLYGAIYAR